MYFLHVDIQSDGVVLTRVFLCHGYQSAEADKIPKNPAGG